MPRRSPISPSSVSSATAKALTNSIYDCAPLQIGALCFERSDDVLG